MEPPHKTPPDHRPRHSRVMQESLEAELVRVRAMTIEDRIRAALSLQERYRWVLPPAPTSAEGP